MRKAWPRGETTSPSLGRWIGDVLGPPGAIALKTDVEWQSADAVTIGQKLMLFRRLNKLHANGTSIDGRTRSGQDRKKQAYR